jgi:predicted dehydrogenase
MAPAGMDVKPLITDRVKLEDYEKIYGNIGRSRAIGSILVYSDSAKKERIVHGRAKALAPGKTMGIIGAGNFTKMTVLPTLKKCGAPIRYISSANGLSGTHLAKKYAITKSSTDYREMLQDPELGLVIITTRHNLHAQMAAESLNAGKDVFVEKPLALTREEFKNVKEAYGDGNRSLSVGFNRRFSPHTLAVKKALGAKPGPMNLVATMNAGTIPPGVWVHDTEIGGGRIIGEACHLLDLMVYLAGSPIEAVCMNSLGPNPEVNTDNASILLRFVNGSNGVVNYFANGHKAYSKERVEVYTQGRVAVIDNFRKTEAYGFPGFKRLKTSIDKGHQAQFKLLTELLVQQGEALIPFPDIENVTLASFAALESLLKGEWVEIG